MILKGNQRAGAAELATHLLNEFDNEQVQVSSIRGTVARDLHGTFAEFDAAACGTRCKKPLYSLSINPPSPLTRDQYGVAIESIEERLGLTGQPRAVVFHVKHGREHCHVVWSRIDTETMRAIHMSHDRIKLRQLSRELALGFGLSLPEGLSEDRGAGRDGKDMTFAEKAQAEDTGITPAQRRAEITAAYCEADNADAFRAALEARGYRLARGDRRGFVVVDRYGHVHSLARQIEGAKTRDINAKLAPLTPEQLPSAEEAKALAAEHRRAHEHAQNRRQAELRRQARMADLARKQAERRRPLEREAQEMKTRHMAERLKTHAAQKSAADALARERARADSSKLAAFMRRVPVYAAAVRYFRNRKDARLATEHDAANKALAVQQANETLAHQRKIAAMEKVEARERRSLERQCRREERIAERRLDEKPHHQQQQFRQHANEITASPSAGDGRGPSQKAVTWKDRAAPASQRRQHDRGRYRQER